VVRQACHPHSSGSVNRRIAVKAFPGINARPFKKKKKLKQKGLRTWLKK
jgi:hypothetical protein